MRLDPLGSDDGERELEVALLVKLNCHPYRRNGTGTCLIALW
jgi:hypothetical protein